MSKPDVIKQSSSSTQKVDQSNKGDDEDRNSIDDLPLPFEEYGPPLPPDGGWGWMVCLASFFINLVVDGVCYTFGIFFSELVNYFETSKSKAALAGSMVPAMYLIAGPVVSSLANKFGCKRVAIAGSLLSCFAFVICIFSPSIEVMTLTYGVMGGIGFGMMYLPSIVMVGFYFDKKRALATGIAVCGSGIGTFLFAPLGTFLVENYGWKGANLIIGAISLNGVACALVFRPLEARKITVTEQSQIMQSIVAEKKRNRTISTGSLDGSIITKENRLIKEQIALASRDVIHEVENEDTVVTPPAGEETNEKASLASYNNRSGGNLKAIQESGNAEILSSTPQPKQLEKVKNMEIGMSQRSITQNRSMGSSNSVTYRGAPPPPTGEEKRQLESPFARQDIFYAGSVTTLTEYKDSSDMASYVQSITSIPGKGKDGEKKKKSCMPKFITQMLDFSLLKSLTFISLCLAGVFVFVGLYTPFVYVAEKAMRLGVEKSKASLIISVLGIFNTLSRLVAGWLADRPWSDCLIIHNVAAILAGAATCVVPLLNSFELLMAYAIVFGSTIAAFIALRSIVLVELLGIEKLTSSFGLTALFQGIAVLLGSPLSGAMLDATGSFTLPFLFSGAMIALGGLVCLPARKIAMWEKNKKEYKQVKKDNV